MTKIDRGIKGKLRGHWSGTMTPLDNPKMRTVKDLSLILKVGIIGRTISGQCSFHIEGSEYQLSVKGELMGRNSMRLEATKNDRKYQAFNMIFQIVATLDEPTLLTGKGLISGNAFGNVITTVDIKLEKQ